MSLYKDIKEWVLKQGVRDTFTVFDLKETFYIPKTNLVSMWLKNWWELGLINKASNNGTTLYYGKPDDFICRWEIIIYEKNKIYSYLNGTTFTSIAKAKNEVRLLKENEDKKSLFHRNLSGRHKFLIERVV